MRPTKLIKITLPKDFDTEADDLKDVSEGSVSTNSVETPTIEASKRLAWGSF